MKHRIKETLAAPLLVLITYILTVASGYIDIQRLGETDNIYLALIIIQTVIFVLPGILYCKIVSGRTKYPSELNIRGMGASRILFTVFAFFVLLFGSMLVKIALYKIGYSGQSYTLFGDMVPTGRVNILYVILALAILPALTEEFIFRGILTAEYKSAGSSLGTAIIISALMFAMLHFSLPELPVYFYCGVILAVSVYITGSILSAVIIHAANNIMSLFFEDTLLRIMGQRESTLTFFFILLTLFILFTVLCCHEAEMIIGKMGRDGEKTRFLRGRRFKNEKDGSPAQAFLSPTFLLCVVCFLIVTLALR